MVCQMVDKKEVWMADYLAAMKAPLKGELMAEQKGYQWVVKSDYK